MKIFWTVNAVDDLKQIIDYLHDKDTDYSQRLGKTIKASVIALSQAPLKGRIGRVADTREKLIFGSPYIIVYGIREDKLIVYRVIHSSRKYP